jgi:hypothetical protein
MTMAIDRYRACRQRFAVQVSDDGIVTAKQGREIGLGIWGK